MHARTPTALAALTLSLFSTMGLAQSGGTSPSAGESAVTARSTDGAKLADTDRKFVERAAAGGVAEVEMGKLAQQKAASGPVKQYAARMTADHGKANDELKQLAQSKGLALPAAPAKPGDMDKLSKLSGPEFDREYMAHMVRDHRKTVAEFKKASESARDSEIKAFAAKTLPTLQEHLRQAESIHDSVKSASR